MIELKAQRSKTILGALALISLSLALGGAAILVYAMLTEYDPSIMHFEIGSVGVVAAVALCVAGAVCAAVGFFTTTKRLGFRPSAKFHFAEVFVSTLAGLLCFFYLYLGVTGEKPSAKIGVFYAEMALAALSGAFFILKALGVTDKYRWMNLFGLFPALLSAFTLLRLYFTSNEPLNAPLKTFEIVMTVALMLGFAGDAGVSIEHPGMSRKYAFASLFGISAAGMVSISRVAARLIDADTFEFNIVRETFRLVFWLYIVTSFAIKYFRSREIPEEAALSDNEAHDSGTPEETTEETPAKEEAPAEEITEEPEAKAHPGEETEPEGQPEEETEPEKIPEEETDSEEKPKEASEPEEEPEPEESPEPEPEKEPEPEERPEPEEESDGELRDYVEDDDPKKNDPGELHFNPEAK